MNVKRLGSGGLVANTITKHRNKILTLDLYSQRSNSSKGIVSLNCGSCNAARLTGCCSCMLTADLLKQDVHGRYDR